MKRFALKRITALVLAFIMTLSLCPVTAFATGGEPLVDDEQVYVVEEPTEPVADASEPVAESEPEVSAEDTESEESEYALEPIAVAAPLANSAATTAQARWGVANENNKDSLPGKWVGEGTLSQARNYANSLTSGTAYIQLLNDVDIPGYLYLSGTVILDLYGYTIDRGLTAPTDSGEVVYVRGNLTLCDTSATAARAPGKITGGYNTYSGGGVCCQRHLHDERW